jgi:hypothetical protein
MKGKFTTPEGKVVLEGVEISLSAKGESEDSQGAWSGHFRTKRRHELGANEYRLDLSDGRFGNVVITKLKGDRGYFTGNGPLKRPSSEEPQQ